MLAEHEITVRIGGEAGQGILVIGTTIARAFARSGWFVFMNQDIESRIRGGHSFLNIRASSYPVRSTSDKVDLLIALDGRTFPIHRESLKEGGSALIDPKDAKGQSDGRLVPAPLETLAVESAGDKLMMNSVAAGAAARILGFPLESLDRVIRESFAGKSEEVISANSRALRAGAEFVEKNFPAHLASPASPIGGERPLLRGNDALSLGAIAAGCRFMSSYPMSPATGIMEYLASTSTRTGIVVEQAEDEIAAVNMAIGASFAGARPLVATSGGGFSLMVEGLGLAGMTESPVVIIEAQRPGPSTGLPTRTEQADLEFVMHAAQGEFPRAVLTPGSPEEAFGAMVQAFNLAERFQTPVIVLVDEHLCMSACTIDGLDFSSVRIERGELITSATQEGAADYVRYRVTPSGVSPRAIPGTPGVLVKADSDEHGPEGHITESAATRVEQASKRMRKFIGLASEIFAPKAYGPSGAERVLVGWGSTFGSIVEAVDLLNSRDAGFRAIHMPQVWPFPVKAFLEILGTPKCWLTVENNITGQLARVIRTETGKSCDGSILKFDGRPFSAAEIANRAVGASA